MNGVTSSYTLTQNTLPAHADMRTHCSVRECLAPSEIANASSYSGTARAYYPAERPVYDPLARTA